MILDCHVYTKYTPDSIISPEDIVEKVRKEDVGVIITDKESLKGYSVIKRILSVKNEKLPIFPGVEYKTDKCTLLLLFIEEIPRSRDFYEVCDFVKEVDGLIVIPYFDNLLFYNRRVKLLKEIRGLIDAVELYNPKVLLRKNINLEKFSKDFSGISFILGTSAISIDEVGKRGLVVHSEDIEEIKNGIRMNVYKFYIEEYPTIIYLAKGLIIRFFKKWLK